MASDAPTTGARARAPRNAGGDVPPPNNLDQMTAHARNIGSASESVDAMVLGIEVMIENQRKLMREQNVGTFLLDNELWTGIAVLLTMVRTHAFDMGKAGEAIEIAGMAASREGRA